MTTRRVVLQHAVNLVVAGSAPLPASHTRPPAWLQTWDDLHIEVARQAQLPGQQPVTREEAWYLLRVHPSAWPVWLYLYRTEGCREIAIFAAVASKDRLLHALHALEDEISSEQDA